MKFKVKKSRNHSGRVLLFEGDKGDELDYVDAERLQRGDLETFLPFTYEKGKKAYEFTYYLGAHESLKDVLGRPFAPMQLRLLLTSLLRAVRLCEENDLSRLRVVFDPEFAFFDPSERSLRFAYVPLRSFSSPLEDVALLARICETADVPDCDRQLSWAALDYARRTAVLTSVSFEEFLRGQGLYGGAVAEGAAFPVARDTDELDMRTSHGWDFVQHALRDQRNDERKGQRFLVVRLSDKSTSALGEGSYTMGRSDECSIAVSGARGISRLHARISVREDSCSIVDLGSTNGVFVNGTRIVADEPIALHPGDRFALAHEEFELL